MSTLEDKRTPAHPSSQCTRSVRQILLITCLLSVHCSKSGESKVERKPIDERTARACTLSLSRVLSDWFLIVESGNAQRIGAVVDRKNFHWISVSKFTKDDTLISIHNYDQLADYVRRAPQSHERMRLIEVIPNDFRGEFLEFGPLTFERSADNLPAGFHRGIGKGEYHCGVGLTVLSIGPAQ